MTTEELADVLQVPAHEVRAMCAELAAAYDAREAGIKLVEWGGSWQLVTRPEHAVYLRRMASVPPPPNLSSAALEVLAIIAYHQPITRYAIESLRGVQSDRAIATLLQRQLIQEVGREDGPGRPILYGTTDVFLQAFGLQSLDDLPPLPEDLGQPEGLSIFDFPDPVPRD